MKKQIMINFILVCLISIILAFNITSCNDKAGSDPMKWNEGGKVLAKCGNVKITQQEVDDALLTMQPQRRSQITDDPNRLADFAKRLLELKLASLKALELGIEKTDEFSSSEKELAAIYSIQTKVALQELLIQKEITDKIIVTDNEALEYYNANLAYWERIEVSEIFIKLPPSPSKNQISEKEKLAQKIYGELRANKITWNTAVTNYSDSPQVIKDRKGSKGVIHRKSRKLPSKVTLKAFELSNENDYTEPISDNQGFYIIKLDKKVTFNEQKETIKRTISNNRIRTDRQDFLENLKTEPIEYFIEGYDPNSPIFQTKPKTPENKPDIKKNPGPKNK